MAGVLDQTDVVVKHRPQLLERRAGYDIYDSQADLSLGSIEQVGRDNVDKLLHPKRSDSTQTPLELSDGSGPVMLMTYIQAPESSLVVAGPDGSNLGLRRRRRLHPQCASPSVDANAELCRRRSCRTAAGTW